MSARASSAKGHKHSTTVTAAERSTMSEKVRSVDRGSARQSRARFSATKPDTTASLIKPVKVRQNVTVVDLQSECSQNSAAAQLGSSKKSTGRSEYKRTENLEKNEDGTDESTCFEGHAVHSDHDSAVVWTERLPDVLRVNVLPHTQVVDNGSASNVHMNEAEILPCVVDGQLSRSADGQDEGQVEVAKSFQTPGVPRRARSIASPGMTFASIRKTPKNLRNSLLLRRMSPEEG